jgi:IPT/TIG domain/Glucodextranase, domain B/Kelch motif/Galactose oxidase, central domain
MRSVIFLTLTLLGLAFVLPASAQTNSGTWTATGSLNMGRYGHTATLLNNGLVFVVGGTDNGGNALPSAELYNPVDGTFAATGGLNAARAWHSTVALPNGTVLVAGGYYVSGGNAVPVTIAELYDPVAGTFTNTGSLVTAARLLPTATLLANGKVLIAGGSDATGNSLTSAELYDPATGAFTSTGSMNSQRQFHAATLLNNSKVLVTGGYDSFGNVLSSAELYDPVAGTFTTISAMNATRFTHTSTLLNNGQVLIGGGYDLNFNTLASAELYDSVAGSFTLTGSLNAGRGSPTATLLNNWQVLFVGGTDQGVNVADAELYDPAAGTFAATSSPTTARYMQTATLLNNGTLVVAGGATASGSTLSSAEIYIPLPSISNLSPTSGPVGATVTITGSNFGLTQGTSTVSFNGTTAMASSWSDTQIVAPVPSGATTGAVRVTVNGTVSNNGYGPTFTVGTPPNVLSTTPSMGTVGTVVTIFGQNFGATQSTSTVSFNGTVATPSNWSNTQIVVPVPASALTGSIIVSVSGLASGGVVFTVTSSIPPSITATVLPAPNANGWNNSSVTVTFNCTAGSSAIVNCPSSQSVSSEGANQIISGTATDAAGLSATAHVSINIDKTQPAIIVSSPTDGTTFANSDVTVSGSVSDVLSGIAGVTCDGLPASVTGGSFFCNISLTVGVNLVVVRVNDLAGNAAGSNFHLSLTGTLPAPNSLQITPANVNMVVGQMQQFTVVDERGRPRPDATWIVSDGTRATITTDSSPVLTSVAVGQATLTATVSNATAQAQVNILPGTTLAPGAVLWSAAPITGLTVWQIVQGVPTDGNIPPLYTNEHDLSGNAVIRAFSAGGGQLWEVNPGPISFYGLMPDGFGGLLQSYSSSVFPYSLNTTLTDRDGPTGSVVWSYVSNNSSRTPAIREQDGAVFFVETTPQDPSNGNSYMSFLVGLSGITGSQMMRMPLPTGLFQIYDCNGILIQNTTGGPDISTSMAFDSNSNLFFAISVDTETQYQSCAPGQYFNGVPFTSTLSLYEVKPDGSALTTLLHTTTEDLATSTSSRLPRALPQEVIPDGQGGALVGWIDYLPQQPLDHVAHVAGSGVSDDAFPSLFGNFGSMVLGENGAAYMTDTQTIQAFDVNSMQPLWVFNSQAIGGIDIMGTASGGGLGAKEFDQNNDETVLRFNSSGQPTYDASGNATPAPPFGQRLQISWSGALNGIVPVSLLGQNSVSSISAFVFDWAHTFWGVQGGSPSPTSGSKELSYWPPILPCGPGDTPPCAREALDDALAALRSLLSGPCSGCSKYVFTPANITTFGGRTQEQFYNFMSHPANFYDGTRSTLRVDYFQCGGPHYGPSCPVSNDIQVKDYMAQQKATAISQTPSQYNKMMTFFDPKSIVNSRASSPGGQFNQAVLFHEGLHGFSGYFDFSVTGPSLFSILNIYPSSSYCAITRQLLYDIWGSSYPDPTCP